MEPPASWSSLSDAQKMEHIAHGHAFDKHAGSEIPTFRDLGITTPEQLATHLQAIVNSPATKTKMLKGGRQAWYDETTQTLIIHNPSDKHGGSTWIESPSRYRDLK